MLINLTLDGLINIFILIKGIRAEMHYTITYQEVLPPYVIHHQNLEASSIEEAKKLFYKLHPYQDYANEVIIRVDLNIWSGVQKSYDK